MSIFCNSIIPCDSQVFTFPQTRTISGWDLMKQTSWLNTVSKPQGWPSPLLTLLSQTPPTLSSLYYHIWASQTISRDWSEDTGKDSKGQTQPPSTQVWALGAQPGREFTPVIATDICGAIIVCKTKWTKGKLSIQFLTQGVYSIIGGRRQNTWWDQNIVILFS